MADHHDTTEQDAHVSLERLREIITDIRIAMITTEGDDGVMHSRPMYLQKAEETGVLWFVTSSHSPLAEQIRDDARVIATFAKPDDHLFAVIRGTASLHHDRGMIEQLWNVGMKVWFPDGPSDPKITLVRIHGEHGDYWDAPGGPARLVAFVGALFTGVQPDMGDRVHVDIAEQPPRQTPHADREWMS